MVRPGEDFGRYTLLDDHAALHDSDPIANLGYDA